MQKLRKKHIWYVCFCQKLMLKGMKHMFLCMEKHTWFWSTNKSYSSPSGLTTYMKLIWWSDASSFLHADVLPYLSTWTQPVAGLWHMSLKNKVENDWKMILDVHLWSLHTGTHTQTHIWIHRNNNKVEKKRKTKRKIEYQKWRIL